jgi:hypothetical protein
MHVCAVQNPLAVRDGKEDVTGLLDSHQHFAVCPAADALCGEQSRPLELACLDHCSALLKPIAAQVGELPELGPATFEERLDVLIARPLTIRACPSQKRRIPHDHIGLGPVGLLGILGSERSTIASMHRMLWMGSSTGSRGGLKPLSCIHCR